LQNAQQRFKEQGIGLAAVSYDSAEIMKFFAAKHGITYPLLGDAKSEIIRRFGVLNPKGRGMSAGMAVPGYCFVGPDGKVKETFFDDNDYVRYTANNVIAKLFPELTEAGGRAIEAPHVGIALSQSDRFVAPGNSIELRVDVTLPAETHVYAPGVQGYKPIWLEMAPNSKAVLRPAVYPASKTLLLPAIKETVPVFEGKFQIREDLTISLDQKFLAEVNKGPASGTALQLNGVIHYQACDASFCYPPDHVPVSWDLLVMPLDGDRAPEAIRHK